MAESFSEAVGACIEMGPASVQHFAAALEPEWIETALTSTGAASIRQRKLPAQQVLWLVLGMCLYADRSIRDVCDHLSLVVSKNKSLAPSALPKARYRLGPEPLEFLFRRTADEYAHDPARGGFADLSLFAIDGTHLRVPDSDENFEAFGKPASRNGAGDAGYPQVRLVALLNIDTRMLFAAKFAPFNTGEIPLADQLWDQVPDNSLTLMDRGFISFKSFASLRCSGTNRHLLVRMPKNKVFVAEKELSDGSMLGYFKRPFCRKDEPSDLPERLAIRVIHYQNDGGVPSRLFTTLLDHEKAPADDLIELYHDRWEVEVAFDELKTHLRDRRECLRSRRPEGISQEIWALLLLYNLVRQEMLQAADAHGVPANRISFWTSLHVIRTFWLLSGMTSAPGNLPKQLRDFHSSFNALVLPKRRSERRFPRHVKIKMSNYPRNRGKRGPKPIEQPEESA